MATRAIANVKNLTSGWWPLDERHPLVQMYMAHSVCRAYDPSKRMSLAAYDALVKHCGDLLYRKARQVACSTLFSDTAKCAENKKCMECRKYIAGKIAHMMKRYVESMERGVCPVCGQRTHPEGNECRNKGCVLHHVKMKQIF